ncbi:GNAT family N-acetyltransferase [Candidatus Bathyarchaeota archaeon]|nr:GNAT family N-acetyltransferase [Candidatus Bathyarchaeota archaeon]
MAHTTMSYAWISWKVNSGKCKKMKGGLLVSSMNEMSRADPFSGRLIWLRPFELEDLDQVISQVNQYEARISLGNFIPWSSEQEKDFIEKQATWADDDKNYHYAIIEKSTNDVIGGIGLFIENTKNRTASLGIGIYHPRNFDKGYGSDAIKCMLSIGFDILNLHRIELYMYAFNARARHVYEKLGFKYTGRKRDVLLFEGMYHDAITMDMLEDEYREFK